jgi:tripartite ATP-independent transporter DctP family solute receptor
MIARRTFLAASLGVPLLALNTRRARAAEFELKWGCFAPPDHPLSVNAVKAAERISQESNGRIAISYFPSSQLGGDTDMLAQLRSGALDLYTNSASFMTTLLPTVGVSALGFAFKDYGQIWSAVDGEAGKVARTAAETVGIHAFEKYWDLGFRTVSSGTRPIVSLADLQGFKIRIPVLPMYFLMFKLLGAAPVTMNFSELYTSLQTHLVEGQENPLGTMYNARLYEVQKYISLTNHCWEGMMICANRDAFQAMPSDVQDILTRNINAAGLNEREDMNKINLAVRGKLEAAGIKFNDVDTTPFREKLKQSGYYKEWRGKIGEQAWTALEQVTGPLS